MLYPHIWKPEIEPWLVCLSGLSTSPWNKRSPVQLLIRAHAWVVGQVPSWRHMKGNHTLMFLSLFFSLPAPLSKEREREMEREEGAKEERKKEKERKPEGEKEQNLVTKPNTAQLEPSVKWQSTEKWVRAWGCVEAFKLSRRHEEIMKELSMWVMISLMFWIYYFVCFVKTYLLTKTSTDWWQTAMT